MKNNNKQFIKKVNKNKGKKINGPEHMFPRTVSLMPTELKVNPISNLSRRYGATALILNQDFSIVDLLKMGFVATTAILGNSVFRAVRLKKMRIWGPITTQGTAVNVSITPESFDSGNNSFNDIPDKISDTSISIDRPAFVSYTPNPDHPSGSWHYNTTVNLALIKVTAPIGAILQFDLEAIYSFSDPVSPYTEVLVAATAGTLYSRPIITSLATVVGLNSI